MFMRSAAHALAPSTLLVSLAALLWGCTGTSSGNDPAIRRRFDVLADQIAELQGDIEDSRQTLADLSAQMGAGGPGGSTGGSAEIASLQAADQELRRSIDELRQQLVQMSSDLEVAQGQRAVTTTLTPASSQRPAERPAPAAAAPEPAPAHPAPEVASAPAPPAEPAPEAEEPTPRVRGTWHTFTDGESLTSIASHYNISMGQLLEANALPANVRLLPGQSLFIPQGS